MVERLAHAWDITLSAFADTPFVAEEEVIITKVNFLPIFLQELLGILFHMSFHLTGPDLCSKGYVHNAFYHSLAKEICKLKDEKAKVEGASAKYQGRYKNLKK